MNHVELSDDAKSQMFSAIIYINRLILGNPTIRVCNNIHKLRKVFKLK